MKKQFLFAIAVTMLTACVNTDTFRDYNAPQGSENDGSISFTSFADNVTKAENSNAAYSETFYDHQESFQVWGRKSNQPTHEIFAGSAVTVTRTGSVGSYEYTYAYSPVRFWDKNAAEYHFYAAAPARTSTDAWKWTFNGNGISSAATLGDGYFTIAEDFTLNEVNLKHADNGGADNTLDNIFKDITVSSGSTQKDIDLLIAAPCEVGQTYYNVSVPNAVNLNFIHILSKLNVTIKTSLTNTGDGHHYAVKLLGFEIKNIPNVGTFDESSKNFETSKQQIRWTLTTPESNKTNILTGINGLSSNTIVDYDATSQKDGARLVPYNPSETQKMYIVESLIIPQKIAYERVALDALAHTEDKNATAEYYTVYEEYEQDKHNDIDRISEADFKNLYKNYGLDGQALKTSAELYGHDPDETETATYNSILTAITKKPVYTIDAYSVPTKPYFTITYSIDDEVFTANYNLAAAFLNYNNDNKKNTPTGLQPLVTNGDTPDPTTFSFYEGWQNTLNIVINPTEITFTADVAKWSDIDAREYEIERGNENPVNP